MSDDHGDAGPVRRPEELFAKAFRASPAAMAIAQVPNGHVIDVNDAAVALVGYTRDELVGRNAPELGLWTDPQQRTRIAQEFERHGFVRGLAGQVRRKSGEVREVVLAMDLVAIDAETRMLVVLTDVTDQRSAERSLQEAQARLVASEERYRRIVESSAQGVITIGLEREITVANQRAAQLLGTTPEALLGRRFIDFVAKERHAEHEARRQRRFAGATETYDTVLLATKGERVLAEVTSVPLTEPSGRIIGALLLLSDVTLRRQLEASLRETEERLRQAQKLEAIGALAGGIAHDFNNLLSIVLGAATLIEDGLDRADPLAGDARAIREAAERGITLTRQLLAFGRRQLLQPRVVSIGRVVAGIETMLRSLVGETIELVLANAPSDNVLIDPNQFEQVIMNLAVNARDAMPGGGQLEITSELVDVAAQTASAAEVAPGRYVRMTVRDTGLGMDEATRARLFEPFFTTKETGKGTGLGLATVFGIIRQSNGFVRVDSALGRGTRVEVFVPWTDRAEPAAAAPPPASPPARGRGETILVVEDEAPVRELVQKLLRRQGYHVLAAANPGEALLLCEPRPQIDLLLTDVVMPIMNGRQLAERLRALYPELPTIFLSGYHEDDALREMLEMQGVGYLQKPARREVLLQTIRTLLEGAREPRG